METSRTHGRKRLLALAMAILLCLFTLVPSQLTAAFGDTSVKAEYLRHGTVEITCEAADDDNVIVLEVGESVEIVVTPYGHVQYTGCGKCGCPDVCEEEHVEYCFVQGMGCRCDPTAIERYADVSVSIEDESVISASEVVADETWTNGDNYHLSDKTRPVTKNGTITITANEVGMTTITVVADTNEDGTDFANYSQTTLLAHWISAQETFTVIVVEASESQTDGQDASDEDDSAAGEDASDSAGDMVDDDAMAVNPETSDETDDGEEGDSADEDTDDGKEDDSAGENTEAGDDDNEDDSHEIAYGYFEDVTDSTKYWYEAVYTLADAGYVTGKTSTYFGALDKLTRAQMVTILWRIAEPEAAASYSAAVQAATGNTTGMDDVESGAYYTAAVNWAVEAGIITGKVASDGTAYFDPSGACTFQQFCTIVARYLAGGDDALEATLSDEEAQEILSGFADVDDIAAYAEKALAYCVLVEAVDGKADGTLAPTEAITRARGVTVLYKALIAGVLPVS